eukprot:1049575-Prorocentrum_minimum.AAC.12
MVCNSDVSARCAKSGVTAAICGGGSAILSSFTDVLRVHGETCSPRCSPKSRLKLAARVFARLGFRSRHTTDPMNEEILIER